MKITPFTIAFVFLTAGCSIIPAEKEAIEIAISSTSMNDKRITFHSNAGSFWFSCSSFSSENPHQSKTEFQAINHRGQFSTKSIYMANVRDMDNQPILLTKSETLSQLASLNTLSVDWEGVEILMPKFELNYDNSVVQQFISDCSTDFDRDKSTYLQKKENEEQLKQEAAIKAEINKQREALKLIEKALTQNKLQNTKIGGEINLQALLADEDNRKSFLAKKNIAYLADFSGYIVTQSLGGEDRITCDVVSNTCKQTLAMNKHYVLRHYVEKYGAYAAPIPLILHTKQFSLAQGKEPWPLSSVVIYNGIQRHQLLNGDSEQFVSLTMIY